MRRSLSFVALTAGATVLVVLAAGLPASAVTDTTPPTLTAAPYAAFVVGTQDDWSGSGDNVAERFTWQTSDPSGICGSRVWEVLGEGPDLQSVDDPTLRSWLVGGSDDPSNGLGSEAVYGWWINAVDCAGNETDAPIQGSYVNFTQDDNQELGFGYADTPITYSRGNWGVSNCTCWSGGTVHRTSTAGAWATFTKKVTQAGQRVALIMEKAPNRGKFKVYVDDVYRSTVDTYAASPSHRIIVWQTAFNTTGAHTVKIVNLATSGRPRIDLDVIASQVGAEGAPGQVPLCGNEYVGCYGINGPTTSWSLAPVLGASLSDSGTTPTLLTKLGWTVADAHGIAYDLVTRADASSNGDPETIWRTTGGTATSSSYRWRPVVHDETNDSGTFVDNTVYFASQGTDPGGKFGFGDIYYGAGLYQDNDSSVSYSSGWSPSSCTCWSGGTLTKSSTPGATATFPFNSGVVSYIGDRASDRGTADIYLDGVFKKHVSLTSSTKSFRTVLYHSGYLDWGNHTITVKVVSGRVDVDGFVVS